MTILWHSGPNSFRAFKRFPKTSPQILSGSKLTANVILLGLPIYDSWANYLAIIKGNGRENEKMACPNRKTEETPEKKGNPLQAEE